MELTRVGPNVPAATGTSPRSAGTGQGQAAPSQAPTITQPAPQVIKSAAAQSLQALERAVTEVESRTQAAGSGAGTLSYRVELGIDKATGRVFGQKVDRETGEVVAQIPSEEMLALLARARELLGPLFDHNT